MYACEVAALDQDADLAAASIHHHHLAARTEKPLHSEMYPSRSSILLIQPLIRPLRPPNILSTPKPRLFTHNSQLLLISPASPRPQLPFLHTPLRPLRSRNNVNIQYQLSRLLTTERKKYIKDQLWLASKWTAYGWAAIALALVMFFGVQEERIERKFPSPGEWTWRSRHTWRSAKGQELAGMMEYGMTDWASVGVRYRKLIERLEDPSKDGAGITESLDGGILVAGVGKTGVDVSNKSEPWRHGYYEALMGSARVAEHLDGCLKDTTRNIVFPAEVVIGPSNPRPRPVPPGAHSAPLEENCTRAYATPESIYSKILTTTGFSTRQRLDAALAYADWLDYKDLPQSAEELYSWALDIAVSGLPPAPAAASNVVDRKTGIIDANADQAPLVTSNILLATTALATHHARNGSLSTALPILLSVLRARRSLPPAQPSTLHFSIPENDDETYVPPSLFSTISSLLRSLIVAPPYPPEPPSGNDAPKRDGKEICDEAGLMANVGEILFASGTEKREDGLAWTREAVDVAEATFTSPDTDLDGRRRCQECLDVGLGNWRKMVENMVLAEKAERQQVLERKKKKSSGWFGGGASTGVGEEGDDREGRWMREERVVEERMRSVRGILLRQRIAGKGEGDGVLLFG